MVFPFFFFFKFGRRCFWSWKKKGPSQDRVWERQKKAIKAFIRLFIPPPLFFSLWQEDKIVLTNGYSINHFVPLLLTGLLWSICERMTPKSKNALHDFEFVYKVFSPPVLVTLSEKEEGDRFQWWDEHPTWVGMWARNASASWGSSVGMLQGRPRYLGALLLLLSAEGLRERAWCGML